MESLRGSLLISSGGLYDPNFRHTVVLVGEHNADGALGVVLNHALNVTVGIRVARYACGHHISPRSRIADPLERLFEHIL